MRGETELQAVLKEDSPRTPFQELSKGVKNMIILIILILKQILE